eukprot:7382938-Prymnesium_polylepis.1
MPVRWSAGGTTECAVLARVHLCAPCARSSSTGVAAPTACGVGIGMVREVGPVLASVCCSQQRLPAAATSRPASTGLRACWAGRRWVSEAQPRRRQHE